MSNWHLNGAPMSDDRRAEVWAKIDRQIADRATFESGDALWWYRTFRNEPAWYSRVTFVRYAGKTRALVTDTGGYERRVPVDALSRDH